MFGINIPIIFGEYIYYKTKYPKIERKNKKGFLENKGYTGSSLPLYKSPFELSNMENEVSKYDDKIIFSVNIDKLYDDIYNFKKNSTSKIYSIDYNLCDDFKNRNYNNVEMKNCNTSVKNIERDF
jgi:hemerythrin superfamily protein